MNKAARDSKVSEEFQSDKVARILHLAYSVAGSCFMLFNGCLAVFQRKTFPPSAERCVRRHEASPSSGDDAMKQLWGAVSVETSLVNTNNRWWIMKRTANPFQRVQNIEVEEQKLGKLSIRKATSNVPTAKGTVHERNSAPVEIAI